ncbi:MAG: helix-turn-helix domain-containing protein [Archaeoglobaceae archaeon]
MNVMEMILFLILAEDFGKALEKIIREDLKMDVREFARRAKISESTIYKLISGKREPNLRTLRQIIKGMKRIFGEDKKFIAVIASRPVLNLLLNYSIEIDGEKITIREYPANSFEDAIVSAVKAERDGAKAIVCAPILSPTLEKLVKIPIVTIIPKEDLMRAIELAAQKVVSQR